MTDFSFFGSCTGQSGASASEMKDEVKEGADTRTGQ